LIVTFRLLQPSQISGRKTSYGDYDSELVDGKYVTSVPILSPEEEDKVLLLSKSNLRSEGNKGLRDLKRKESLMERLTSSSSNKNNSNVFDRLSNNKNNNLSGSRRSLNVLDQEKKSSSIGALSRIKDLTKNLRKNSKEELVAPRDSRKLLDGRESRSSLDTKTSLEATNSLTTRRATTALVPGNRTAAASAAAKTSSPRTTRRATAAISKFLNNSLTWTIFKYITFKQFKPFYAT